MNPRRVELLEKLVAIEADLISEKNTYDLNSSEKNNTKLVIDTLKYLVNHFDDIKHVNNVYFIPNLVPIHLEEYPQGDGREEHMDKSLIGLFIDCVKTVKDEGDNYVKTFCSKLDGNCIDGRTRGAFDYAQALREKPTFVRLINNIQESLESHQKKSYSFFLVALINTAWHKAYRADTGKNPFTKEPGFINLEKITIIDQFLQNILGFEFNNDFILAYKKLQQHHGDFLKIILPKFKTDTALWNNKNYLASSIPSNNSLSLQAGLQELNNTAEIYQNILSFKQVSYNNFFKKSYVHLFKILHINANFQLGETTIPEKSLYHYFNSASVDVLRKIIKDNVFKSGITSISPTASAIILDAIFDRLTGTPFLTEFLNEDFYGGSILHYAAGGNNIALVKKILNPDLNANFDIFKTDADGYSTISIAALLGNWEIVELLSEVPSTDPQHRIQHGKTLTLACGAEKWELATKLIRLDARLDITHPATELLPIHYAVKFKKLDMLQEMRIAGADLNYGTSTTPPLLHYIVTDTKISANILVEVLMLPEIEVNIGFGSESPLLATARSGQFDKLQATLLKSDLDDTDIVSSNSEIISLAESKQFIALANLLKTYRFIYSVLTNTSNKNEDLGFITISDNGTEKELLAHNRCVLIWDLFNVICNKHNASSEEKAKTLFVLNECLYHFKIAQRDNSAFFSFKPKRFVSTTYALNQTFLLAARSTEADKHVWQNNIREFALDKLEKETAKLKPEQQLAIYTQVHNEPIFAQKRGFSLWRHTNAYNRITDMINKCKTSLKRG